MLLGLDVEEESYFEFEFIFALIVNSFLLLASTEVLSPKVFIDFYVYIRCCRLLLLFIDEPDNCDTICEDCP